MTRRAARRPETGLAATAGASPSNPPARVRCAIYTRKSTEKGLEREFNSLDAQREACEAFVTSQKSAGWTVLRERYEDGGFTGGNMERPALRKLLADIEAGLIDCVVTYKVDRLSRSLLDFARMMEVFERKGVSFVSVTQHFNTAIPMGRLILNVLLSFAQFEREIIAERVRDKMGAARRKGKWVGGHPILGYDVDRDTRRLVVNPEEAERVREIFRIYAEERSLLAAVRKLEARGWTTKERRSKNGRPVGGRPFDKSRLWDHLTNWTYVGKVRYRGEVFEGEHEAIVDGALWDEVQDALRRNGRGSRSEGRLKHESLLRGLLVCQHCNAVLINHFSVKSGTRRYFYYVCGAAMKRGWGTCPTKALPAEEMDRFVVDQIRAIGSDRRLRQDVLRCAQAQVVGYQDELEAEKRKLREELRARAGEVGRIAGAIGRKNGNGAASEQLAAIQARTQEIESRLREIQTELASTAKDRLDEHALLAALAAFDPAWDGLSTRERGRLLRLLLERIVYDPERQAVRLTFRPAGIRALAAPGGDQESAA